MYTWRNKSSGKTRKSHSNEHKVDLLFALCSAEVLYSRRFNQSDCSIRIKRAKTHPYPSDKKEIPLISSTFTNYRGCIQYPHITINHCVEKPACIYIAQYSNTVQYTIQRRVSTLRTCILWSLHRNTWKRSCENFVSCSCCVGPFFIRFVRVYVYAFSAALSLAVSIAFLTWNIDTLVNL